MSPLTNTKISFEPNKSQISKRFKSRTLIIYILSIFLFTLILSLYSPLTFDSPLSSRSLSTFIPHILFLANNFTTPFSSLPNTSSTTTTTTPKPAPLPSISVKDGSSLMSVSTSSTCDMFDGRWVYDESTEPSYEPGSCPYVGDSFNCFKSGRRDLGYLKYRWQPFGCDIPRFDGMKMIDMLRGKRMVFVGDSLNRNMWDSLICSLGNVTVSGRRVLRRDSMSFEIKDYDCSITMITSPFLVQQWKLPGSIRDPETPIDKVRLDMIDYAITKYSDADFLIFNTGHWWNHGKVQNGENFFQEGDVVHEKMDMEEAFNKALNTWAKWIDNNVNKNKTQIFFVGYTATHFRGGEWNGGGNCHKETKPIEDEKLLEPYPWMMRSLEVTISKMSTPVTYLNITRLTDYRSDGHPSIFRRPNYKWKPGRPQDCSHWCLPGVPDSWNRLLFASLMSSFRNN